ncbi:mobile mystery protein B [Pedobacter yulinensis]|uniref:mobile mystery protein B n=1 Tax=Pedobacter yulinensis TaxID=2126353 RepID=UPI0019551942|nr:mobile mystery protein B [Pedobacter yulinensis]
MSRRSSGQCVAAGNASRIFTEDFICQLHVRMYGQVWGWAGNFRKTNKNIGIHYLQVRQALRELIDDAGFWVGNSVYPPDELAIRFKHRLVSIHCFPNGNGRHSRLMADIISQHVFKQQVFSWGGVSLVSPGELRKTYIAALRLADGGTLPKLIRFARS